MLFCTRQSRSTKAIKRGRNVRESLDMTAFFDSSISGGSLPLSRRLEGSPCAEVARVEVCTITLRLAYSCLINFILLSGFAGSERRLTEPSKISRALISWYDNPETSVPRVLYSSALIALPVSSQTPVQEEKPDYLRVWRYDLIRVCGVDYRGVIFTFDAVPCIALHCQLVDKAFAGSRSTGSTASRKVR